MNESKHTSLPWTAQFVGGNRDTENAIYKVIDAQGKSVCEYAWKESADLIVRAANSHDALVAALEGLLKNSPATSSPVQHEHAEIAARAALAKAKGE